jgi:glycosyltransferase involved in cell wall biosynthesis
VPKMVLILTTEDPKNLGGMEIFVSLLARGLQERGFDVKLFHKGNCLPPWLSNARGTAKRMVSDITLGWYIGRQAQRNLSEDVVGVISNSTVGWYSLANCHNSTKRIHFSHGTYAGQADAIAPFISRLGKWKLKWWDSMLLERMSGKGKLILCNSDQTADELRDLFGQEGRNIWLPFDVSQFGPLDQKECRAALGLTGAGPVGLFVGNTSPMKNFQTVRSLVSALPEVQWILALRGSVPTEFKTGFGGLLLQDVPQSQLPTLYNAADFTVCPSFYEPFGYVVAESLASGTPVVASLGGASRAFLTQPPFDRFLIQSPSSVADFTAAIQEILRDPAYYKLKVGDLIRPKLLELLAPENWWRRFFEATGLNS